MTRHIGKPLLLEQNKRVFNTSTTSTNRFELEVIYFEKLLSTTIDGKKIISLSFLDFLNYLLFVCKGDR